jgi:hypothetical protein
LLEILYLIGRNGKPIDLPRLNLEIQGGE